MKECRSESLGQVTRSPATLHLDAGRDRTDIHLRFASCSTECCERDGTFWVSDEYGPFLIQFDRTGRRPHHWRVERRRFVVDVDAVITIPASASHGDVTRGESVTRDRHPQRVRVTVDWWLPVALPSGDRDDRRVHGPEGFAQHAAFVKVRDLHSH